MKTEITDKELLTYAAKAAFNRRVFFEYNDNGFDSAIHKSWLEEIESGIFFPWNPLANDGDALRLAVKLEMKINCMELSQFQVSTYDEKGNPTYTDDSCVRRAIVRAAAEIGRNM